MGYYIYRITVWDDDENKEEKFQGVVWGATYVEAMKGVTDYYGNDELISVDELMAIEEYACLELSEDELARIKERAW